MPITDSPIQVWRVSLARAEMEMAERLSILSADERARAARFIDRRSGVDFVMVRSTLRSLLGAALRESAGDLKFHYGATGRPTVVNYPGLRFSVSHARDVALIAIAQAHVGVDVEFHESGVVEQIFGEMLTPEECARVARAVSPTAAFYDHWTMKEAFLKVCGSGLSRHPRGVHVDPDTTHWFDGCVLVRLPVVGACSAALAVRWPQGSTPNVQICEAGDTGAAMALRL